MIAPLLVGFAFGFALQKGKLGRYETIVNVFLFRDLTVVKFLVSALMVSMLGVRLLVALGLAGDLPVPETQAAANLAGGLVFGAGMALAGFCPGTVAAGAGEGRLDYVIPGVLGLTFGALVHGAVYARLAPFFARLQSSGPVALANVLHVDGWWLVVVFWEIGLLLFYALERGITRARPA